MTCNKCNEAVEFEDCYIADGGLLCSPCCYILYPERFSYTEVSHNHEWKKYIGFTHVYDYCDCGETKY